MDTVSSNECVSSSTGLRVEKEQNSASFNDVIIFKLKGITPRKFIVFHRGTAYDVIIFRSPLSSASKAYSFSTFRLTSSRHGRPQKVFQRGRGDHQHFKKWTRSRRKNRPFSAGRRSKRKNLRFCDLLNLIIWYLLRAPKTRAKICLGYCAGRQQMT